MKKKILVYLQCNKALHRAKRERNASIAYPPSFDIVVLFSFDKVMFKSVLLVSCLSAASAFVPVAPAGRASTALAAKSKAVPFLEAPAALDG